MLLVLHPRRLSAPAPQSSTDTGTWSEDAGSIALDAAETFGWYDLASYRRGKRNTLLSTYTSGVPSDVCAEDQLKHQ